MYANESVHMHLHIKQNINMIHSKETKMAEKVDYAALKRRIHETEAKGLFLA